MGADCGAIDAVMAAVCHDFGQTHRHSLPDPGFAPSAEPAMDSVPASVFGRHVAPQDAAPEAPEYAVDDRAVLLGRSSSATVLWLDWQQALQDTPFCFGKISPAQACVLKRSLESTLSRHVNHPSSALVGHVLCSGRIDDYG